MSIEEKIYAQFVEQYPEYTDLKEQHLLHMNIYCDIIIINQGRNQIIAVSDVPHDLRKVGNKLPHTWVIKETYAKKRGVNNG